MRSYQLPAELLAFAGAIHLIADEADMRRAAITNWLGFLPPLDWSKPCGNNDDGNMAPPDSAARPNKRPRQDDPTDDARRDEQSSNNGEGTGDPQLAASQPRTLHLLDGFRQPWELSSEEVTSWLRDTDAARTTP